MNTKGVTGSSQIGPLKPEKTDLTSTLLAPNKDGKKSDARNSTLQGYGVNLSQQAKDLAQARAKAMQVAKDTSSVREDRVAALKKRIESGNYQIDSGKIADGMLAEAMRDEVATQMHNEAKTRSRK